MGPFEKRYVQEIDSVNNSVIKAEMYNEAIGHFYFFRKHGGDNMAAKIFDCLQKADPYHMECFYRAFPEYVVIHEKWLTSGDEKEFFKKHGYNF